MTDFLKNNPAALRHCLLYEFLQGKPIERAFSDFCDIVGDDAIKKKQFQFWFDKFFWGSFDDTTEQIDDMRDILRNDKHALRACVLYEYLSKNKKMKLIGLIERVSLKGKLSKVFEKYIHFCKVIGDDAMKYREFESWFYRFSKGKFDLNYERDKNKKIYEMTDMPIDIMKNIVKYLGIVNRSALAGTCRSFKNFVENQKLFYHTLELKLEESSAEIRIGRGNNFIRYRHRYDGCDRTAGWNEKRIIPNVSYWKQALQDFKGILNYPNLHLDTLKIDFLLDKTQVPRDYYLARAEEAISALGEALNLTHHVSVKDLKLHSYTVKPLLKILPALKPGYLTTMEIVVNEPEYDVGEEIASLEQWKRANSVAIIYGLFVGPLHHFRHIKEFRIRLNNISVEIIRQIKEILFKSPDFERCSLGIRNDIDFDVLSQEFGNSLSRILNVYHYPAPNPNEYFEIIDVYGAIKIGRMKK